MLMLIMPFLQAKVYTKLMYVCVFQIFILIAQTLVSWHLSKVRDIAEISCETGEKQALFTPAL